MWTRSSHDLRTHYSNAARRQVHAPWGACISLTAAAGERHQYLRGAGALFDTDRLGPGERANFRGIARGIGAHRKIAGGQSVEHETAVAVRFGIAGTVRRLQ